jgi:hypothetical protein
MYNASSGDALKCVLLRRPTPQLRSRDAITSRIYVEWLSDRVGR